MTQKHCRECGKEIYTSVKFCPGCGEKYPGGGKTKPGLDLFANALVKISIILFIIAVLVLFNSSQ